MCACSTTTFYNKLLIFLWLSPGLSTIAHRRTGFSPFFWIGVQVKVSYDRIDIQVHNAEGIGKNRTAVR
jgi:hypothetical protein